MCLSERPSSSITRPCIHLSLLKCRLDLLLIHSEIYGETCHSTERMFHLCFWCSLVIETTYCSDQDGLESSVPVYSSPHVLGTL